PGYTPEDPNGNPLTPVDPEDPSKGYIPPTPENPGVDTPITYVPVTPTPDPEPTPKPQPEPQPEPTPDPEPVPAPKPPVAPASPAPVKQTAAQLPNTGESNTAAVSALGAGMLFATLALAGKRRKKDEE
ncbi:LPXTG cell wall anchor domain-containing protein, partial [Streptococcus suis]